MDRSAVDARKLLLHDDDARADANAAPPVSPTHASAVPRSPFSWRTFWAYTGPGWLMSMAYLDPGNLEANLQSGAYARYELLYVVLLSTAAGGVYQLLAVRLGAVTGRHLAQHCRAEYPRAVSLALWVMTELAIVGSDVQEVLGSAIAFQILFQLPLWAGCLLTGVDTLTFLLLHRSGGGGSRYLELFFMLLITTMCVCFFADFTVSAPDAGEIARGIVWPRLKDQNVMQAVASLGAIIMPHNLFLHSALVQARAAIDRTSARSVRDANFYFALETALALFVSFLINAAVVSVFASSFFSAQCAALSAPDSISGLAGSGIQTACVPLKAALASGATIYDAKTGNRCHFDVSPPQMCSPCFVDRPSDRLYGFFGTEMVAPTAGYCQEIGLAEAGDAVKEALGGYARVVWAIGLLASGQASTMTGTYAGQFVMEGFLDLKIAAWKRVALTRGVALVPAVAVALISQHRQFKSDHFNELLNVLQSVQLPFALLPLLTFTSTKPLMGAAFVTSRAAAFALLVGTGLLCSINYALVYRVLTTTLPKVLPLWAAALIALIVILYASLLLYLVLGYPSSSGGSIQGYEDSKARRRRQKKLKQEQLKLEKRRKQRQEQQALLSDDEVEV